ncbi:4Fe-4S dicluster domain-containing protein, partial [Vibrio sp. Vb0839]|uniref:4Fe-4S dicluster domain-containing protein n=1 Tax=Vibrio sp. Vb0839 TaxID=3074631 RepID=UPI0029653BA0
MSRRSESLLAKVTRILPFSCVDGPGNRLVIFLQGCNYQCLNCHNPHTINHCNHCGDCVAECPAGALKFDENNNVVWLKEECTHCDHC